MTDVFLDTSYAVALANSQDLLHERALELADDLEAAQHRLVTTEAILLEIGNALSKPPFRQAAIVLLESLRNDPFVTVIPASGELLSRGFDLFRSRPDKTWGLVDCVSFVVMIDAGLSGALTADAHFEQAGFRALLREKG